MDSDAINEVRQRAQAALSRARLANDPEIKARWEQIADAWLAKLAHLGVLERPRPTGGKRRQGRVLVHVAADQSASATEPLPAGGQGLPSRQRLAAGRG